MIYKSTAIIFFMACLSLQAYAQYDSASQPIEHYVGVQANQLIRQILNFGDNAGATSSPYLLNYTVINARTRNGANIGFGYTFDQFKTGDATNDRETKINSLFFRAGFERRLFIAKKWMLGLGIDALVQSEKNETTSKTDFGGSKSNIVTNNKQGGFGLGPRANISFRLSNRIFLGTEATYYFRSLTNTGEITSSITTREFDPFSGQEREVTRTEKTETDDKFKRVQFTVPTILWLILKF